MSTPEELPDEYPVIQQLIKHRQSRQVELDFDEILQNMEDQAADGQCIPPLEMMRDHIATLRRWKEAYDKEEAL